MQCPAVTPELNGCAGTMWARAREPVQALALQPFRHAALTSPRSVWSAYTASTLNGHEPPRHLAGFVRRLCRPRLAPVSSVMRSTVIVTPGYSGGAGKSSNLSFTPNFFDPRTGTMRPVTVPLLP